MDLASVYVEEKKNLVLPSGQGHDPFESLWLDNYFPPSDYWLKLERADDTYILLWEIWGVSNFAIRSFEPLFESFPKGKCGFAFAFTWDFEPELVCINADSEVFTGGGTAPECLRDLDCDYFDMDERRSILNRKHWRLKDMAEEEDLNQFAMAMALRRWRKG